jgi:hypothetical protein
MQTLSLRTLFRTLTLSLLVVVGLSVVGCDSGGSNGGPEWTGDWTLTSSDGTEIPEGRIFISLTKDEVVNISKNGSNVNCETEKITNIDGNEITTEDEETGDEATGTLSVSDGTLTVSFEERTDKYTSVDDVPDCP